MNQIPSLADLALQYGTINKKQFEQLSRLFHQRINSNNPATWDALMLGARLATAYQIGLLKLIRDYLIIKKRGEEFGKIAIEKGFASKEDVKAALDIQKKEFKRAKLKKLIGDILVEKGVLTLKQKNEVLRDQEFVEQQAEEIFSETDAPVPKMDQAKTDIDLTPYEKHFLKIQALDTEFAARVIEKQLASERKVKIAQKVQEEAFEKNNEIRILGDIMVELTFLTETQKNDVLSEQKRLSSKSSGLADANFEIEVSGDKLEAWVKILENAEQITVADIKKTLEAKSISHGIFSDAILQCNLDMGNTRFLCAAQDYSVELVKMKKTIYHFDRYTNTNEDLRKGTALAEFSSPNENIPGKDIFGKDTRIATGTFFRCGAGVRVSRDGSKAFAGRSGFPSFSVEGRLFIHPPISVLEDADLRYGPLEPFANLSVSGVLTGAYPVTAGSIKAEEIRGANIRAIGNIESRVGITDSVIVAQGDIKARYLHNCRIETFGDVFIENEIIDSKVFSGGKIEAPNCHVISSDVYGKNGVTLSGAGSNKTNPCIIGAGTEHQVIERINRINAELEDIRRELDDLIEKRDEQISFSKKTFQKMIELKIFHDRAKTKKENLSNEFKLKKESMPKDKLNNLAKLIHNFEKRKNSSIVSLKKLNTIKKKYDKEASLLENKIKKLRPRIKKETAQLKIDIIAFLEYARRQKKCAQIKFHKKVFSDTQVKGLFSSATIDENKNNILIFEKQGSENGFKMSIQKN